MTNPSASLNDIQDYTSVKHCRVCHSSHQTPLFLLGEQFVSDFVPKEKLYQGVRCPIDIELCPNCGLVQNKYTARQDFLYTHHYWYKSGTTQTMNYQLQDVVDSAIARIPSLAKRASGSESLRESGGRPLEKTIVMDIGSNDGTLLSYYPNHPNLLRIGVEPANNLAIKENYRDRGLELIHDFWPGRGEILPFDKAKIVTACGMFYDLEDPNPFIANIKRVLAPDGLFIAQLMCLKQTLEKLDVGNFAHEHLEFYSLKSLHYLFRKHGLEIYDIEENNVNGGSYRLYVRHYGSNSPGLTGEMQHRRIQASLNEGRLRLHDRQTYQEWYRKVHDNAWRVRSFIKDGTLKGSTFDVYGASTKGNVILQYYCLGNDLIRWAADRSPEKHGLYTVGTWIPIVSEEQSRESRPDWWVVLPYAFLSEFIDREIDTLRKGTRFLVPLPTPRVVYLQDGEIKEVAL